ncbi:hypothetical protein [Curtobacterium aetherium]|uniref:Uncharacterized protein n=1 Tax=Curtobacterium aetherium TaxID=2841594 RepID=A0ACD1E4K6_9MICO|nr:hypothetical protein [Curtobacterium sp. L6-1]QWS33698.1 hypothetical protein KM842_00265 [Curtobacterium sp. L6-1]
MNTEPPTGDDLQRMLVSMKQTVLDRAGDPRPAPRRRGRRIGIAVGVVALFGLGATSGAVALGMIPQPFTAAAPTTEPSEPTAPSTPASAPVQEIPDPVPSPTSTPTPTARAGALPTDCRVLVPATEYDRLFSGTPLADPAGSEAGSGGEGPPVDLSCIWRDPRADVSGLVVNLGAGSSEEARDYEGLLARSGYSCADSGPGRLCTMTTTDTVYPVDTTFTYYSEGATWVLIRQTNFPTNGLLAAIQQQVWG